MDTHRRTASIQAHHHSPSLSGTSLQIPQVGQHAYRSGQSPFAASSTGSEFDQSKSRNSMRQSAASSTAGSTASTASGKSSVNPAFYPSSGFPPKAPQMSALSPGGPNYPESGYPISVPSSGPTAFSSAYGFPTSAFPCCDIPGMVDLSRSQPYPDSEFPGGGQYPGGDLEGQVGGSGNGSHGCMPFIGAYLMHAKEPPADGYPDDGFGAGPMVGGYPGTGLSGYNQAEYGGQTVVSSALDPLGYVSGSRGYPS